MNRCRPRYAFSLIELLVVIGLIALLGSLLLIGIGHLITNSKRQQTQLAFQNLQAMYAEYDSVHRHQTISSTIGSPQNVSKSGTDRIGNAVLLTRGAIAQMRSMPVNATALGKMGAGAITSVSIDVTMALAWSPTTTYYPLDLVTLVVNDPVTTIPVNYYFVCIRTTTATALTSDPGFFIPVGSRTTVPPMSNLDSTDATVPLLTDGWGNPIIFVPGGTLGLAFPGATVGPSGMITAGGITGAQVRSPDGRPFFASAGPDEDFSKGDDNMYSYEK